MTMLSEDSTAIFSEPALQAAFEADGFAVVTLLDQGEADALAEAYAATIEPPKRGFQATLLTADAERRAAVDRTVRSVVAAPLKRLLPGFRLCFCTFVAKAARSATSSVPLHQDWSFVDESRHTSIGLWCPLVDVTADNGCLQVVAGSHKLPSAPRGVSTPFAYPELLPALRRGLLRALPLHAGQAVLLHPRLFHGSPPNRSASVRVVAGGVLIPQSARLRYYHVSDPARPYVLDAFEVDDGFYLRHTPGHRPEAATHLGTIEARAPRIDPCTLTALLHSAPHGLSSPA